MLKRTTVFLGDTELQLLKRMSFIQSVSMAELIRRGVQALCRSLSEEEKEALAALSDIKEEARKDCLTPHAAMKAVLKAQKEVRRERKAGRC